MLIPRVPPAAGRFFEGAAGREPGVLQLPASQHFGDGQDLQPGEAVAGEVDRLVEARGRGLLLHGPGGRLEGEQRADGGLFPLQHAFQVPDLPGADVAAFDLDDHFFVEAAVVVLEINDAVHAGVRALFLVLRGPGVHQPQGPPLELVAVLLRQGLGAGQVRGLADDLKGGKVRVEGVVQTVFNQGNGQVGDIDAQSAAL